MDKPHPDGTPTPEDGFHDLSANHDIVEPQQGALSVWNMKYCLKRGTGTDDMAIVDSSMDGTYQRVAKALSKTENGPDYWYRRYLWAMRMGATPAGRIMSNAGAEDVKPATSTINCVVSATIEDDMESIMSCCAEGAQTLKSGCGIGYEFSTLRPKGASVRGAGAYSSGPMSFMRIFDVTCKTVESAGGRRGAQMATFDVSHPDIIDFIRAKRSERRGEKPFSQFNFSVLIGDEFMKAVEKDEQWLLYFPAHENEMSNPDYEFIYRPWPVTEGYKTNSKGEVYCRVYKKPKARYIWDLIMKSTYEFADPGFILIDKINKENNNWFCEKIRSTNPSMPAGTLVHTKSGIVPIELLEDKRFKVRSLHGEWAQAECWMSSDSAELLEVSFGPHKSIRATPEHKWPVYDELLGQLVRVPTKDLQSGDRIPRNVVAPLGLTGKPQLTEDDGFLLGMFLGDGHLSKYKGSERYSMGFTFNKLDRDLAERVLCILNQKKREDSSIRESSDSLTVQVTDKAFISWFMDTFKVKPGRKKFPKIVFRSNDDFIRGFVDGIISSDGYVTSANHKVRMTFSAMPKSVAMGVTKLLSFHGINGSIVFARRASSFPNEKDYGRKYDVWRVAYAGVSCRKFALLFSLTCKRKQRELERIFEKKTHKNIHWELFNVVNDVVSVPGTHKVWDISVNHPLHIFPTEWGYTGNCGEQPLPPYGSCLLGSINLTKFVRDPFAETVTFDWSIFQEVVRIFTRMLDNVIESNGLPLQGQRDEIIRKRRHGMGFYGLGSALAMMRIVYGSKEAVEFTEQVSKVLAITGYETGLELAEEKGPAPIMREKFEITPEMMRVCPKLKRDGHKLGDKLFGRELIFGYSTYMKRIEQENPDLVAALRKKGCRFTHHSSIAPTGCVSPDTLVVTEKGVQRIDDLGDVHGEQWQDVSFQVATDVGMKDATKFFINGEADVISITTKTGKRITATPNHQVRVFNGDQGYIWSRMDEIQEDDVIITMTDNYPDVEPPRLQSLEGNLVDPNHYHGRSGFRSPEHLTVGVCEFVGFLFANGNIHGSRNLRFYHHVDYAEDAFNHLRNIILSEFGLGASDTKVQYHVSDKLHTFEVNSKALIDWLGLNGLTKQGSANLSIPTRIMTGGRDNVYAFLRGYFEGDGSAGTNAITISSVAGDFLRDLQILMQSVGIVSRKDVSVAAGSRGHLGDKDVHRLSICHYLDKKMFFDHVGFLSSKGNTGRDNLASARNTSRRQISANSRNAILEYIDSSNNNALSMFFLEFQQQFHGDAVFEDIVNIETGRSETYDLSVPENVTYIANGFVSHNTISLTFGNYASSGIEPSFEQKFLRNIIVSGEATKKQIPVFSYELLAYRRLVNPDADSGNKDDPLPPYFVGANSVSPKQHVDMQAAAQKWIDSSISKTLNCPTDIPFEEFKEIYEYGYRRGLKGTTTFRFNPDQHQGVLVKPDDLKRVTYEFVMEDGSIVELRGDEKVIYEGVEHSASNLYDAILSGDYGRY